MLYPTACPAWKHMIRVHNLIEAAEKTYNWDMSELLLTERGKILAATESALKRACIEVAAAKQLLKESKDGDSH